MESLDINLKEGEALFDSGKILEAEQYFLSLAENGLNNKEVYNNLGVIAIHKNDLTGGIGYFTRSLKIDPLYRNTIVNYTNLLRSLDQLQIAIPLLEKVAELNPDDKEIIQLSEEINTLTHSNLRTS